MSTGNPYFTRAKISQYKAAGVLPYAFHNGKVYALLGAELVKTGPKGKVVRPMWRDFGGQREAVDCDSAATAGREFSEETLGMFGGSTVDLASVTQSAEQMAHQLRSSSNCLKVVHHLKKGQYHMYVAQTAFLDPIMLHLAMEQNKITHAVEGAEKLEFAWVLLGDLLKAVVTCSRQYFLMTRELLAVNRPGGLSKQRMQLHPCFANSLRMAQTCGLAELLQGSSVLSRAVAVAEEPPAANEGHRTFKGEAKGLAGGQASTAVVAEELCCLKRCGDHQDAPDTKRVRVHCAEDMMTSTPRVVVGPEHLLYWVLRGQLGGGGLVELGSPTGVPNGWRLIGGRAPEAAGAALQPPSAPAEPGRNSNSNPDPASNIQEGPRGGGLVIPDIMTVAAARTASQNPNSCLAEGAGREGVLAPGSVIESLVVPLCLEKLICT